MGFDYLKAKESLQEGTLFFTIDLRFPKKVADVLIVNSEKYCNVLRDLVPLVQFKKREKHS